MLATNIADFIFRLTGCIFLCLVSSTLRKIDNLIKNELETKIDTTLVSDEQEDKGFNLLNSSNEEGCKDWASNEKRHYSFEINYIQPSSASSTDEKEFPNIKPSYDEEFNSNKYYKRILGKV